MDRIFAEAAKARAAAVPGSSQNEPSQEAPVAGKTSSDLPKGVVLGPDGKPCRTCTSSAAWQSLVRSQRKDKAASPASPASHATSAASMSTLSTLVSSSGSGAIGDNDGDAAPAPLPADCPPDVERLGRHTWTLLHGMAAAYPERASAPQQADMRGFLTLFARLYPCWACAADLRAYMARPGNAPRLEGREALGRWMCDAHNDVNRKLGKKEFDCARWRERWLDGWRDGRCDP